MIEITVKGSNWEELEKNVKDLANGMAGRKIETAHTIDKDEPKNWTTNTDEEVIESEPKKAPTKKASVKNEEKNYTSTFLKKLAGELAVNGHKAELRQLLEKYNVKKVSFLAEEQYNDFGKELEEIAK